MDGHFVDLADQIYGDSVVFLRADEDNDLLRAGGRFLFEIDSGTGLSSLVIVLPKLLKQLMLGRDVMHGIVKEI